MSHELPPTTLGRARPTLDEIHTWPATVTVSQAAAAFGVSRAHAYESVRNGDFPARIIKVGSRVMVVTASILATLGDVS
jgi:predicted DNA-binding transcriptional regulator AlpA